MNEYLLELRELLTLTNVAMLMRSLVLLVAGFVVAKLVSMGLARMLEQQLDEQRALLARRATYYSVLCLFLVAALHQLGFNLAVLLGAAGVLSVAIGFASQTSASNIISGLFLIAEQTFEIDDVISIGGTTGRVLSVDLLSVKLRTFDNVYVRVPNESMIKSEVKTMTKFPIRRLDLQVGVAYKEDLAEVRRILLEVADRNPLSLDEPTPLLIFQGFGDSSMNVQFSLWAERENFLDLRNQIPEEVKAAFDAEGIEIPFPHRSLYAGSVTDPLPVRLVDGAAPSGAARAEAGSEEPGLPA